MIKKLRERAQRKRKRKARRRPAPTPTPAPKTRVVNRCTPEGIAASLAKVRRFSQTRQLPVFVTEYSVVGWAPGAAQYLRDVTAAFESYGWSSCYFVWEGATLFNLNYAGTRDNWRRSPTVTDRKQVIEDYLSRNGF